LRNPDFVALAESFGADGYRAESPNELRCVLDKAIARDRPAVVVVPMPLDQNLTPWTYLMPASRR
jgi:acetolactate synthase-1/2/3 large subunit